MTDIIRPTALALAFVDAAVDQLHAKGRKAPWTARRVAVNADREVGMVSEPRIHVNVSGKTYKNLHSSDIL